MDRSQTFPTDTISVESRVCFGLVRSNHQSVEGDRFELMMQHANLSNIYVRVEDGAEIPSEAQLFGEE